jgi:hypothetical protein
MYKIHKGVKNNFYKAEKSEEKTNRTFYIYERQLEALEEISNGNPSQCLRKKLEQVLQEEDYYE